MDTNKERILIIEDSDFFRESLLSLLQNEGYEAQGVQDFLKALQLLREKNFAVIIGDVILERDVDIEMLKQLRELTGNESRLVAIIDDTQRTVPLETIEKIVDEFVFKPIKLEGILHVIKRNLKNSQLEKTIDYYKKLAIFDDLTQIYNRRYLEHILEKEIARSVRTQRPLVLLMIDIDNFKNVNDTYGHTAGDIVLQKFAYTLKMSLRSIDTICRYGGEEFVIILPDTSPESALFVAERLRRIVEQTTIKIDQTQQEKVTISIGAAHFTQDVGNKENFVHYADKALYQAKQSGKNKVSVWRMDQEKELLR